MAYNDDPALEAARQTSINVAVAVKMASDIAIAGANNSTSTPRDIVNDFLEIVTDVVEAVLEAQDTQANKGKPLAAVLQAFPGSTVEPGFQPPQETFDPVTGPYQVEVQPRPPAVPGTSEFGKFEDLLANPANYYDNRYDKKNPKGPDFKHKSNKELAFWVDKAPANVRQAIVQRFGA